MTTDVRDVAGDRGIAPFALPDVGEGLTEAEIITWHVAVGDTVEVNQIIVEIETAKSLVELPTPYAGTVSAILAAEGDTVAVGTTIITIANTDAVHVTGPTTEPDAPELLVGYGARENNSRSRRKRPSHDRPNEAATNSASGSKPGPKAKPPVRKLAQVLGVDLSAITPSGPGGIIVRADVLDQAERTKQKVTTADRTGQPDIAATRVPIKGLRKHMAAAMVSSAFTAPHVTEFITIDVTETVRLKERLTRHPDFLDIKLSVLAFAARAYLYALARTPIANARWDESAGEIVIPEAVNLGIAAATQRGLVVPNIASAERLRLHELASAITVLAESARGGKTPPEAMRDGTTTITNVGVFGIDTGTPILNPGETAILAVGAIRRLPWVVDDDHRGERVEPRSVMTLALSFDHRVMDGQQGSRVLADTAAILRDPGMGLL